MKKNILVLLPAMILFAAQSVSAQLIVSGKVTDSEGRGLSYVNIGIKGGKNGTVSTIEGDFTISLADSFARDSLTFSIIGFLEQRYQMAELAQRKDVRITLAAKIATLHEVKISNVKRKIRKLGITGRTPMVCIPSMNKGKTDIIEQARLIRLKQSARILDANIFVLTNTHREATIRINFYAVKNGLPAERLIEKSIIRNAEIKKGWFRVDLSKDDVYLDQDFVVSFEYLPGKDTDVMFGAKFGAADSWLRYSSLGLWRKNELGGCSIYVSAEL